MGSWRSGAWVVLPVAAGLVVAAWVGSGCSEEPTRVVADGGLEARALEDQRSPPTLDATNPTCIELCRQDHRSAVAKDEAVVACWESRCEAPCVLGERTDAGAMEDAGDAGSGPSCTSEVITPSLACDQCTRTSCCDAWDACFQDPECAALNACYQACAE